MKLKNLVVASLVAVAGVSAHATDYTLNIAPTTKLKTTVYDVDGAGSFTDYVSLNPVSGAAAVSLGMVNLSQDIFGETVNISGLMGTLYTSSDSGSHWTSVASGTSFQNLLLKSGIEYKLKVTGMVTGTLESGQYGISYLAKVAPVPEPASMALFLAGIGALGLVGRRRKLTEKDHADAALA